MTYQGEALLWRYHGTCWHLAYYQIAIPLLNSAMPSCSPPYPIYLANGAAVSILSRNGFLIYPLLSWTMYTWGTMCVWQVIGHSSGLYSVTDWKPLLPSQSHGKWKPFPGFDEDSAKSSFASKKLFYILFFFKEHFLAPPFCPFKIGKRLKCKRTH